MEALNKKPYDWLAIEAEFIGSRLSVEFFADEHNMPIGTLKRRVTSGKWLEKRAKLNEKAIRKNIDITAETKAERLSKFDDECLDIAEKLLESVKEQIKEIENPNQLKSLSGTLKEAQAVARLILGASTDNTELQISNSPTQIIRTIIDPANNTEEKY